MARSFSRNRISTTLGIFVASMTLSVSAMAADAPKDNELLRDYVHYVRIARYDLALSNAQAMLDRLVPPFGKTEADKGGISLSAFVKLVDAGDVPRFEESVARGMRVAEVEQVSAKLLAAYEQGKRDEARVADNVTKNIQLLIGTSRQRLVGRERLIAAGEYAMPQLLENLTRNQDAALSTEIRKLMVDMGRQSVAPLTAALPAVEPKLQETLAGILGDIRYKAALPSLYELALSPTAGASTKKAASDAIAKIDRAFDAQMDASLLFENLGEDYYSQLESLTSFPRENMQLVWDFFPGGGLTATPVRSEIFHETMAMRMSERALRLRASNREATALWVASNFRREFDTPAEYKSPLFGSLRDAMYYSVSAGPSISQRVLARALKTRDTALALKAINALSQTAGASALASADVGRPLLDALLYPNRRVQIEAALALAAANPQSTFEGSDRVVPILAGAVRDAGARFAVVVGANPEASNSIAGVLRTAGFTVLPPGRSLSELAEPIAGAPGVDLIVSMLPGSATRELIAQSRSSTRLLATPIVAIVSELAEPDLRAMYGRDSTIALVREGSQPAQIATATSNLLSKNAGDALTADEAAAYQTRALTALRDLAIASTPVFNVGDSTLPLAGSIENAKGKLREQIGEVLARIGSKRAQSALAEATLAAEGDEMLTLINKLTGSAKRFGNLLDDRQVKRFTDMAGKGSDEQATAVAALIGALNLSNDSFLSLLAAPEAPKQ